MHHPLDLPSFVLFSESLFYLVGLKSGLYLSSMSEMNQKYTANFWKFIVLQVRQEAGSHTFAKTRLDLQESQESNVTIAIRWATWATWATWASKPRPRNAFSISRMASPNRLRAVYCSFWLLEIEEDITANPFSASVCGWPLDLVPAECLEPISAGALIIQPQFSQSKFEIPQEQVQCRFLFQHNKCAE